MVEATHTTRMPDGEEPSLSDLEGPIADLVSLSRIADSFVGKALSRENGEKWGESYQRLTLSNAALDDVAFILAEVQSRSMALQSHFYAALEERT